MASPGGSAKIVYDNGCVRVVEPGAVVVVQQTVECNTTSVVPYLIGGAVIAGGVGLAIGLSNDKDKPASP
ncbi:MAG: hypothetical protein SFW09_10640 [Hyphomicrobiaceae bacterium]|nr:hypothetical protein [Hyphomicrobiaceae bacterium]